MHDRAFLDESTRLQRDGVAYCTVTIVDARGSIPQEIGASALFGDAGLLYGTVGGGRLEARCAEQAHALLASRTGPRTKFEALNLSRDVAMTCAGEVTLYYEAHHPEDSWNIAIFGAGHVAQKLCRFLLEFDCHVVCVDTRAQWLERLPRDARLEALQVRRFADGVEAVRNGTIVVVMTMGHLSDLPILEALCAKAVRMPYLGVIGSKSKAAIMRRQLLRNGARAMLHRPDRLPSGREDRWQHPGRDRGRHIDAARAGAAQADRIVGAIRACRPGARAPAGMKR